MRMRSRLRNRSRSKNKRTEGVGKYRKISKTFVFMLPPIHLLVRKHLLCTTQFLHNPIYRLYLTFCA
jgi:hypothetical protein